MALSSVVPQSRALVLGSTSVYRRELLARLRLPFSIEPPFVDESPLAHETPEQLARRLAAAKAAAVAHRHPAAIVIGSDQVADLDGEPLGKPGNHANAVAQLQRMSGRVVTFQTALTVMCEETGFVQHELAPVRVRFRELEAAEIEAYLLAEQPYDCAGSARSEGLGIALLDAIDSDDPTALVGLPLIRTCRMLRAAGLRVF
ncbi:Maf-like protein [Ramlibacter monticola]|uniref:7-methyl-GTP pyrophosphatase n=1 Tax=Ramlibacter monticola TaxID=1926872 RepID=A0A936Z4X4_9BURK|nr:Maf family nucleotide pyrophosphatase [Ramlibacter monticola]MBL0394437.1 septum formation inhibitor Maf [Ramlibacter monticola]